MLSRSTGRRQKTLQVRPSACRWITITTSLFIHVFTCVLIFSLHCEGDKKVLAEAVAWWHKKALAQPGSSCSMIWNLLLGRKATRQPVGLSGVQDFCSWNKSAADSEKAGAARERRSGAAWQAPYVWLIWSLKAHTTPQMEGNGFWES